MNSNDLDELNILHLYERLFKELSYKVDQEIHGFNYLSKIDSSKGWLPCILYVLSNKVNNILSLLTKERVSVIDCKRYLKVSDIQEKLILSLNDMLSTDYDESIISKKTIKELNELKSFYIKINEKSVGLFITAMTLCLDRDLRELGIDTLEFFPDEGEEKEMISLEKLKKRLIDIVHENSLPTLEAIQYLLDTYSHEDIHNGLANAVNIFYDARRTSKEIDHLCVSNMSRRVNYLCQNLDIANIILGGYCNADAESWSKSKDTEDTLPIDLSREFSIYSDLHNLENSKEQVITQYENERRVHNGGAPSLEIESRRFKLSKGTIAAIAQNTQEEEETKIDDCETDEEFLKTVKIEAREIGIRAMRYLFASSSETNFINISFCQIGAGDSHVTSLKLLKKDGTAVCHFRDSNSGCFEFDSAMQFIAWFSEFYVAMGYHIQFQSYEFSYPATTSYQRAYEWLKSDADESSTKLAIHSRLYENDFDSNTGQHALNIYKHIRQPSSFDNIQVLFFLAASSMSAAQTDVRKAKKYINIAVNLIHSIPEPTSLSEKLIHISIWTEMASYQLLEGKRDQAIKSIENVIKLISSDHRFHGTLASKVEKIITHLQTKSTVDVIRKEFEELDRMLSILNTFLQEKLKSKLHTATEIPIRLYELALNATLSNSARNQLKGLKVAKSFTQRSFSLLMYRKHIVVSTSDDRHAIVPSHTPRYRVNS